MEMEVDGAYISKIANGYTVRIEFDPGNDDEYVREKFYFENTDEVLAFLETNLD